EDRIPIELKWGSSKIFHEGDDGSKSQVVRQCRAASALAAAGGPGLDGHGNVLEHMPGLMLAIEAGKAGLNPMTDDIRYASAMFACLTCWTSTYLPLQVGLGPTAQVSCGSTPNFGA